MGVKLAKSKLILFLTFFVLAGCVGGEAYIYKYKEFDRDNPNFSKEIANRSLVEICYNKQSTTPEILLKLAQEECKRFGKNAFFVGHQILKCSIASPAIAVFRCARKK